jgi:putative membrane protein
MMHIGYGFGLMGLWSLLTTFVFLGGIVLLAMWALRSFRPTYGAPPAPPPGPARDPALDLLRQRFAAGEIDAKEFEARRRLLEGGDRP